MLWDIVIFIVSLAILVKGAGLFVDSSAKMAKYFGVSELLIGLTFVALGTSLPELGSSVAAALMGDPSLAAGNIIGSNIANIALVIGLTSLFTVIKLKKVEFFRDGLFMLATAILFYLLALDGAISSIDSLILLTLLTYYLFLLYRWEKGTKESFSQEMKLIEFFRLRHYMATFGFIDVFNKAVRKRPDKKVKVKAVLHHINIWKQWTVFAFSGIIVFFSARFLVISAENLATEFGVSSAIVGLTAIAIGTSLPELTVSIAAVMKGHGSLLVGNIIGSNIANLLLVGGVTALIAPLTIEPKLLHIALPGMLFFSFLFLVFMRINWKITRYEGAFFLILYAFLFYLILL